MARPQIIRQRLLECLDDVHTEEVFSTSRIVSVFATPGLNIPRHAQIRLPLVDGDADDIVSFCMQIESGHGVYKCPKARAWEMGRELFEFQNPK